MSTFLQQWPAGTEFRELIGKLHRQVHRGDAAISLEFAEARLLKSGLELVVADEEAFREYIAFFATVNRPVAVSAGGLRTCPRLADCLRQGLMVIETKELVTLALSPFQLRDLHDALEEIDEPEYWTSVRLNLSGILSDKESCDENEEWTVRPAMPAKSEAKTLSRRFLPVTVASLTIGCFVFLAGMAYQEARRVFHRPTRDSTATDLVEPGAGSNACWMLRNRGAAWVQHIKRPEAVELDWLWVDLSNKASDGIHYSDNLAIAIRCPRGSEGMTALGTNDVTDGLVIRFAPHGPSVSICEFRDGIPGRFVPQLLSSDAMPPETPHHIRIEDDGEWIRVWWNHSDKPVLEHRAGPPPEDLNSWFTGVYNRERIRYDHHSFIMNFKAE